VPDSTTQRREKAFLFFSVDIVDSTGYKARYLDRWAQDFASFLEDFPKAFDRECECVSLKDGRKQRLPHARPWKVAGDEILFYVDIAAAYDELKDERPKRYELVLYYTIAIASAIKGYNRRADQSLTANEGAFLVNGTAWFANIAPAPVYDGRCGNIIVDLPPGKEHDGRGPDFIGRQIDIGFRITEYASSNRLVISVEYAILLLRDNYLTVEDAELGLYFEGRRPIRGILEHLGYPVVYIDMGDRFVHSEYELEQKHVCRANAVSLMRFLQEYIKRSNSLLTYPFIADDPLFGEAQPDTG
jgi:hypothetical protein